MNIRQAGCKDLQAKASLAEHPILAPPKDGLQIHRVLVPVDFSACSSKAIAYAVALAGKFRAGMTLLHVIAPAGGGAHSLRYRQLGESEIEQAQENLLAFARQHVPPSTEAECLVRMGLPHSEIADTAKALACDLIVMGTRGAGEGGAMGSTADWVVHHAYCPVLTLRPC